MREQLSSSPLSAWCSQAPWYQFSEMSRKARHHTSAALPPPQSTSLRVSHMFALVAWRRKTRKKPPSTKSSRKRAATLPRGKPHFHATDSSHLRNKIQPWVDLDSFVCFAKNHLALIMPLLYIGDRIIQQIMAAIYATVHIHRKSYILLNTCTPPASELLKWLDFRPEILSSKQFVFSKPQTCNNIS